TPEAFEPTAREPLQRHPFHRSSPSRRTWCNLQRLLSARGLSLLLEQRSPFAPTFRTPATARSDRAGSLGPAGLLFGAIRHCPEAFRPGAPFLPVETQSNRFADRVGGPP